MLDKNVKSDKEKKLTLQRETESIHSSIFYTRLIQIKITGKLESIPAASRREAG